MIYKPLVFCGLWANSEAVASSCTVADLRVLESAHYGVLLPGLSLKSSVALDDLGL